MTQKRPTLTLIIPTLNGGPLFRQVLEEVTGQSVKPDELLVVDSSSSDDTVRLAGEFGATVISIPRNEFDHGATRSMAVQKSRGEIVLFLTQDAVPVHRDVIRNILLPFRQSESVAISYGRQLPAPDASFFAATLRLFNYPEKSVVRTFAQRKELGLRTAFVSNSCAAYRRSCLEEQNYFPDDLIFGEDTCAAGKLLEKGYAIAYVAEAAVYHSHNYSMLQEFRRSFDIGVLHSSEPWLLETFGRAEGEGRRYVQFELSRILSERKYLLLPVSFLRNLAKYSGYKLGRMYHRLPRWLAPSLSMNIHWWKGSRRDG